MRRVGFAACALLMGGLWGCGSPGGTTPGGTGGAETGGAGPATGGAAGSATGGAGSGGSSAGGSATGGHGGGAGQVGGGGRGGAAGRAGAGGTATGGTGTGGSGTAGGGGIGAGGSGAAGGGSCSVAPGAEVGKFTDPVTTTDISPPNPPGITFKDTDGKPVNAHGGGIIKVCDTFYLHGEYFLSTTTDNNFNGFSMYSSKDLATWKNEGLILPQQPSGQLGPNRKGERPHIIKCPATGEFVLYAHSADVTYQADKEVVYATSATVNGQYSFKGSLTDASGNIAAHSDMSALSDGNSAYVVTESGWVYTLSSDCHSWVSAKSYSAINGTTGGAEAPTVFKAGSTYYWIGSDKTGWRA
ncbi:MAG TPA: family 43 glycosylhydrolase, partial [Polyangia bacterium]|nr:family 43 glycosylhydrolase [Polyangia bacterium]